MKSGVKLFAAGLGAALLSSCASSDENLASTPTRPVASTSGVTDDIVKLGKPYEVAGTTYTPADVANYDDVGYASWYGQELAGRPTANGETYYPEGVSAAHKTLPLPSYVEVTRLDTGRTILVRVNDRGPFANDRLIDLSYGAAQQLGIEQQGVTAVRVRRVNPPAQVRAQLRSGEPATPRNETSESLLTILRGQVAKLPRPAATVKQAVPAPQAVRTKSAPAAQDDKSGKFIIEGEGAPPSPPARAQRPAPVAGTSSAPAAGQFYVQVAAFSSRERADRLAKQIDAKVMQSANGQIFRVRYGPYGSTDSAQQGLQKARQRGYGSAKILSGT